MSIYGGKIADYPEPHKLRSEDPEYKREVIVSVTTFVGTSPGAVHWYASVEEETDLIWDEEEQKWRKCWDHPDKYEGRRFSEQFTSEANARSWARAIAEEHFSGDKYKFRGSFGTRIDWMYVREGD